MLALVRDVRFALRMLARNPATTLVAVFTLALAIGVNTSIFSAVNAILLRPLPYADPDQLVMVLETQPDVERMAVPYLNYLDYKAENTTFSALVATGIHAATVTGKGNPEQVLVEMVSHDTLPALGVAPALGRNFLPEEDAPDGQKAVILRHGYWARRYAADPAVLGQTITLGGSDWTIVGVMPPDFRSMLPTSELMIPVGARASETTFRDRAARPEIYLLGRMKPGVREAEARADLQSIGDGLAKRYPKEYGNSRPLVLSLNEEMAQPVRGEMAMLMASVICVLLIAAANVANLMLERAMRRQKEMQIRAALGSGRWRLIRQLLIESLLVALFGAGLGLLLALWGVDLLAAARPPAYGGIRGPMAVDATVLGYTLAVALGTGLLFGLVPALQASRQNLAPALKDSDRHASAGGKNLRARNLLVVGEVALALMLLIGAVAAIRGLIRVQAVDPGFDPDRLLMSAVSTAPSPDASPAVAMQFWEQVRSNIAAIPGVVSVGWSAAAPFVTDQLEQFQPLGAERTPENMRSAGTYLVSPGYLETMKIPVLAGRTFGPHDGAGTAPVLIIDEALAEAFFPGQDPVGQRLQDKLSGLPSVEIVGVVGHVKQYGLDAPEKTPYQMYYAFAQLPEASQRQVRLIIMHMIVRFEGEPLAYVEQVRSAVTAADPLQPLFAVGPYTGHIFGSLMTRRYTITLLSVFAGLALVLAAVGLYAVMGNTVAQRTHELGVRMALGAQPRAVVRLVVRQGMALVGAGVAIGAIGALAMTRAMSTLLPGMIDATDPSPFLAVTPVLVVVGLLATYIPARRATRIDPMVALRHE
ncbi:ABC transporter permease [Nannocystis punicea]|uniref:ABC transporter permease n=1 Tax=Nannocystis punicea TaxID=2995304 RepID=A0ABY7HC80_9BACT|nr:ABC transporter permease [Nannocystis poenicansa]WAS96891.1 ABC transporter permease [Nannocystis poenicansa]